MKLKVFLVLLFVLAMAGRAEAVTVRNLTWTPNVEENLVGYRFYLQNVHNPGSTIFLKETPKTTIQITLTFRIPKNGLWQIVMTAYNTNDVESPYSKGAYYVRTGRTAYWSSGGVGPTNVRGLGIQP